MDIDLSLLKTGGKIISGVATGTSTSAGDWAWVDKVEKLLKLFNETIGNIAKMRGESTAQSGEMPRTIVEASRTSPGPPPGALMSTAGNPLDSFRPYLEKVCAALSAYESGLTGGKGTDNIVDAIRGLGLSVTDVRKLWKRC